MRYSRYPTAEQNLTCFIQSQNLTSMLLDISMVRLDERTGNVYIVAGKENTEISLEIGIVITRDGKWRYEE